MLHLLQKLYRDEAGFIVSAELVLIGTIAVLSMVVGLAEVSNSINNELEDVADAYGSVNQDYSYGRRDRSGRRDRGRNNGYASTGSDALEGADIVVMTTGR